MRERYGDTLIGSSTLLARRLVEAGVTFVTVTTEATGSAHWDTHENNFQMLREFNLPQFDQIFSALVSDLEARGLLESTLVVAMGDMGRSRASTAKQAETIGRSVASACWPAAASRRASLLALPTARPRPSLSGPFRPAISWPRFIICSASIRQLWSTI